MIQLKEFCGMCRSHSWCGRECRNAPGLPVRVAKAWPAAKKTGRAAMWKLVNPDNASAPESGKAEPAKLGQRLIQAAKEASEMAKNGTVFDKATYQRDYMRKKRAKTRAPTR